MNFVFPEYGLEEVYFHKHTIVKKSRVSEREFNILLLRLLKYVNLIPLDVIVKFREEADRIMGEIDRKDTPFVALALAFNCPIWSDDNHFKKQKEVKIFTTKDILRMGTK
jgi:predicted nucleic acid-binding protein